MGLSTTWTALCVSLPNRHVIDELCDISKAKQPRGPLRYPKIAQFQARIDER